MVPQHPGNGAGRKKKAPILESALQMLARRESDGEFRRVPLGPPHPTYGPIRENRERDAADLQHHGGAEQPG